MFYTGDSKTAVNWQTGFAALLDAALPSHYYVNNYEHAHEAYKVADLKASIDADLALVSATCHYAFVNIGINDILNGLPADREQVESDFRYILDAIHAKWPSCRVMVALIWARATADGRHDTFDDVWIPSVLSQCLYAEVGVDERIWIEGGDNGVTNTYDGVHYSNPAGYNAISNGWMDAIGYGA